MADLTIDPERVTAYIAGQHAELDRLYAEINELDDAIDERRRDVHVIERRLELIRERFGIPAEATDG